MKRLLAIALIGVLTACGSAGDISDVEEDDLMEFVTEDELATGEQEFNDSAAYGRWWYCGYGYFLTGEYCTGTGGATDYCRMSNPGSCYYSNCPNVAIHGGWDNCGYGHTYKAYKAGSCSGWRVKCNCYCYYWN